MISDDVTCRSFSSRWPGPSFWAPACRGRGGVTILCSDRFGRKQRHERTLVSSVFNSEGTEVSSLPEIIEVHEKYYDNLFTSEEIDLTVQNELLSHVLARLPEAGRASCEGSLTLAEASEALKLSNRNKTPGPDGLLIEFYLTFWSSCHTTSP